MVRKAQPANAGRIFDLIQRYAEQDLMLPRKVLEIQNSIGDFFVFEKDGNVAAACSIKFGWDRLAEIRSLAVHPEYLRQGIGTKLVRECLAEAMARDMEGVFVLTYADSFFEWMGFEVISKGALPLKVWADCMDCSKRNQCDEIAMVLDLESPAVEALGIPLMEVSSL